MRPYVPHASCTVVHPRRLEQDKAALAVRFRAASESRVRLEKTVKSLVARSSLGGSDPSFSPVASPTASPAAAAAPEPLCA